MFCKLLAEYQKTFAQPFDPIISDFCYKLKDSTDVPYMTEAKLAANRLSPPDGPVASIGDHEKFLKKYSGRVLHPNNVLIVDVI